MYVVFTGDTGHWWSRFIKKDMGHCYVIVPSEGMFIVAGKNTSKYDLDGLDKEWFCSYVNLNENKAVNFVNNLLEGQGHLVTKKSILEGVNTFKKEEYNG